MKSLLGQVAFEVADRRYLWDDVWLAAHLWGDWAQLTDDVRRGLAGLKRAETAGALPTPEELTAAANEFRYQRELLGADETRAWLEGWGLSLESWTGFVRRSLLKTRRRPDGPALAAPPVGDEELEQALHAELVCSGRLGSLRRKLAGRAAVYARFCEEHADPARVPDPGTVALPHEGLDAAAPAGLDVSLEKRGAWARLEHVFRRFCRLAPTARAVRDSIRAHAVAWTRLELQSLAFVDRQAALEAAHCVSQDGRPLAEVAGEARVPLRQLRLRLQQLDAGLCAQLRSARPGQLLGPLAWDGEFRLLLVVAKVLPSERDPEIRRRAARDVARRAVEREIEARVRWEERFRC